MTDTVALVLASLALVIAVAAAVGVVLVGRQSAGTRSTLRRHRLAHRDVDGTDDPELLGARPRRGAQRYAPPTGSMPAVRPDDVDTGLLEQQDLPTVEAQQTRPRPTPREDTPR